jgi:hypothetical protein
LTHPERQQRQRCKVCWNADGFNFDVPDEVWEAVVPPHLQGRVVCLQCFDDLACAAGVDYGRHLTTIYFAGRKVAAEFVRVG